jgi:hypothetical protein
MKTNNHKPAIDGILNLVIAEINEIGRLRYSPDQLAAMRCKYANTVVLYLKNKGYIDERKKLIKPIEIKNPEKEIYEFIKSRRTNRVNPTKNTPIKFFNNDDRFWNKSDKDLVEELRDRGYEVTAKKIIEL